MLFHDYDGDLQPSNIEMNFADFWVRIHDLPLKGMAVDIVKQIGESLDVVEDIDLQREEIIWKQQSKA